MCKSQIAVQAGHAVAEWCLWQKAWKDERDSGSVEYQKDNWENGTLVYLEVQNEEQLSEWRNKILDAGINMVEFKEPDMDDKLTAIACHCDGSLFKRLRLLTL